MLKTFHLYLNLRDRIILQATPLLTIPYNRRFIKEYRNYGVRAWNELANYFTEFDTTFYVAKWVKKNSIKIKRREMFVVR